MRKNIILSAMALVLLIFILCLPVNAASVELHAIKGNYARSIGLEGRYVTDATCYMVTDQGAFMIDSYGKKWETGTPLHFNEHVVLIVRSNYTVDDDNDDWIEDILRSIPEEMSID